jgi:hypothetical protein
MVYHPPKVDGFALLIALLVFKFFTSDTFTRFFRNLHQVAAYPSKYLSVVEPCVVANAVTVTT